MAKKQKPPQAAKVIAIANQKGGTAKTTSAVNLGIGLANRQYAEVQWLVWNVGTGWRKIKC